MSYIEERIKYLAVQAWQRDKSKHELTCGNNSCEGKSWGGTMAARMRQASGLVNVEDATVCILECHDCGHEQFFVPQAVIDNFLERI